MLHGLTYSENSCIKISFHHYDPAHEYADRVEKLSKTLPKKYKIYACDYNGDCIVRVKENRYTEWKIISIQELEIL
jgi:hypothetical protein